MKKMQFQRALAERLMKAIMEEVYKDEAYPNVSFTTKSRTIRITLKIGMEQVNIYLTVTGQVEYSLRDVVDDSGRQSYYSYNPDDDHETVIEQKPGAAFRARNIACTLEKESASLSCDLSGAYGDPRIRRVMRKSTLYKNALCYAVIEDQYDTDLACVLSLITAEEPAIQKDASGDFVIRIGELATVCVSGASHVRAERLPIQDPRLQKAWKHDCFRILLETAAKQLTLKFT